MTLKECWEKAGKRFPFVVTRPNCIGISDLENYEALIICALLSDSEFKTISNFKQEVYSAEYVGADMCDWELIDYLGDESATAQNATALQRPTSPTLTPDEPKCNLECTMHYHSPGCAYKAWNDVRAVKWNIS